jgi:hypothetical protein
MIRKTVRGVALFFCFIIGISAFLSAFDMASNNNGSGAGLCFIASVFAFGIVLHFSSSPLQQQVKQISFSPKTSDESIIQIDAKSGKDAALQIVQHLNQARADGWTTGKAFALIDGWRNEYQIEKGNQKSILAFDMRPALKNVPSYEITMMTMIAAVADPDIEKKLSQLG